MDFINQTVTHTRFGVGKVTGCDGKTVTVSFEEFGARSFIYPDAFKQFLQTENLELTQIIDGDIARKRIETEESARKAAEDRANAAAALAAANLTKKPARAKKATVNLAIKPNKPPRTPKAPKAPKVKATAKTDSAE